MDQEEYIIISFCPSRVRVFDNYELPGGRIVCIELLRFLVEFPNGERAHRKIPFRVPCDSSIGENNDSNFSTIVEKFITIKNNKTF